MIRPRIIPLLLIEKGNLIKTKNFKNPIYLGDPINAIRIFNEKEVDELCIIDKSAFKFGINFKLLKEMANEAFMPLSYGGGINNLDDAKKIIAIGFEKIILNTLTFKNSSLLRQFVIELGSQSVVASIDYKRYLFGGEFCCYQQCKIKTKINPITHAFNLTKFGIGEILLTSVDNEGTMNGFDSHMINKIRKKINIPIIAHGGAGNYSHIKEVLFSIGADAVAIGSMFVFWGKKKGILINYPNSEKLLKEGIFKYEKMQ